MSADDLITENKKLHEQIDILKQQISGNNIKYADLYFKFCYFRNNIKDLLRVIVKCESIKDELSLFAEAMLIYKQLESLYTEIESFFASLKNPK